MCGSSSRDHKSHHPLTENTGSIDAPASSGPGYNSLPARAETSKRAAFRRRYASLQRQDYRLSSRTIIRPVIQINAFAGAISTPLVFAAELSRSGGLSVKCLYDPVAYARAFCMKLPQARPSMLLDAFQAVSVSTELRKPGILHQSIPPLPGNSTSANALPKSVFCFFHDDVRQNPETSRWR